MTDGSSGSRRRMDSTREELIRSSASSEKIQSCFADFAPALRAFPKPSHRWATIVAPLRMAMLTVSSALPESTTTMSLLSCRALSIHSLMFAASFFVMMTTEIFIQNHFLLNSLFNYCVIRLKLLCQLLYLFRVLLKQALLKKSGVRLGQVFSCNHAHGHSPAVLLIIQGLFPPSAIRHFHQVIIQPVALSSAQRFFH